MNFHMIKVLFVKMIKFAVEIVYSFTQWHWLSDYMRYEIYELCHVNFALKLVVKRKRWSRSLAFCAAVWNDAHIQRSVVPHQNSIYCLNLLKKNDIIWKMGLCFLSKVTINKSGSFLRSSTSASGYVFILYLFGTEPKDQYWQFSVWILLHH